MQTLKENLEKTGLEQSREIADLQSSLNVKNKEVSRVFCYVIF